MLHHFLPSVLSWQHASFYIFFIMPWLIDWLEFNITKHLWPWATHRTGLQLVLPAQGLFNVRWNLNIRCPRLNIPRGGRLVWAMFPSPNLLVPSARNQARIPELGRSTRYQGRQWCIHAADRSAEYARGPRITWRVITGMCKLWRSVDRPLAHGPVHTRWIGFSSGP